MEDFTSKPINCNCKICGMPIMNNFLNMCSACIAKREEEVKREEEIQQEKILNKANLALCKKCNIEPEFYTATLDNFIAKTPSQKKALQAMKDLISGKIKSVVLSGSHGLGKTHLLSAVSKIMSGIIYSMFEISAQTRNRMKNESEIIFLDELSRLPVLCIDEIGRTKGSDAEINWLSYIIDKRHTRKLPIILASNKKFERSLPKEEKSDALEYWLASDIISRLIENGVFIEIEGEDARKNNKYQN